MAKFNARFADARRLIYSILGIRYRIPGEIEKAVGGVADDAELIFQAFAPRASGRLARGIRAIKAGKVALVFVRARDPRTGYDYVAVTRFGHRRSRIRPRSDRAPASVVATGSGRATGGQAALRFTMGGRVLYRRSVRGFKPRGDWAEKAEPQIQVILGDAASELGQDIAVKWAKS